MGPLRTTVAALLVMPFTVWANGLLVTAEGPGSPDGGAGTEFSSSHISLTLPLENKSNRRESVRSYVHLDQTTFDLQGTTAAQGEYFWLSMPLQYTQRRDRHTEFLIHFEPGLMTDLNAIDSDAVGANIELYGRRYRRGGGFWQFGLVVDRAFGDFKPRPAVAASWQATKATQVLLGFPRTKITTQWSSALSSFLHIRPAGGVWREEISGQSGSHSVNNRTWRIGVGGEFHWRKQLWLTAEFGQTRLRTIEATDSTGATQTSRPGDDTFTRFGINFRF